MPELLKSITGSITRAILSVVGGWLINKGYISPDDWQSLVVGIGLFAAAAIWAVYQRYVEDQLLKAGLELPAHSSIEDAKRKMQQISSSNNSNFFPILIVTLLGLSMATVACARRPGAATAVYSAQTVTAWYGVQQIVAILDANGVIQPGSFYVTHDRITNSLDTVFTRLEKGGYDRKDILTALDQIAVDIAALEQDLAIIQDPGTAERFKQVIFSVRLGLSSVKAVLAATDLPDKSQLARSARSSRPTTKALWWNDVINAVTNTFIRATQQSYMTAPEAWADMRTLLTAIREVNAEKLKLS